MPNVPTTMIENLENKLISKIFKIIAQRITDCHVQDIEWINRFVGV